MEKFPLLIFLFFIIFGTLFATRSLFDLDLSLCLLLATLMILIFYGILFFSENQFFYIFSKSNKHFPSKMLEGFFALFSGILFPILISPIPFIILNFIGDAINSVVDYSDSPGFEMHGFNLYIIISIISILFNILFLNGLKLLIIPSQKINRKGGF